MAKYTYYYGVRHIECKCGVWRVESEDMPNLPCWNESYRAQLISEIMLQLRQSVRNLGYRILKALRFVK